MFLDKDWNEPLPIYYFLIEHPEGYYLVDTGDAWRSPLPGYLTWWNFILRSVVEYQIRPEEEIGFQLSKIGIIMISLPLFYLIFTWTTQVVSFISHTVVFWQQKPTTMILLV